MYVCMYACMYVCAICMYIYLYIYFDIDEELYDKLIDLIADAHAIHDLYVSMADITSDRAISWTRLRSTLIFLEDTLTPVDNAILHIDVETIKQLLRRLAGPEQWPFLQQDLVDHSRDADLATLEDHCDQVGDILRKELLLLFQGHWEDTE